MVPGAFIDRARPERTTLESAMKRYLAEVSPTKSEGTQRRETVRAKPLLEKLGDYSLVAVMPELVAKYRDSRLDAQKAETLFGWYWPCCSTYSP